jgi:hypothetical protein
MLKKINTRTLVLALLILGVLLFITLFRDSVGHEKTFRDTFYNVDSSQIKTILLYPQNENHQEVRLMNVSEKHWEVQNKTIKSDADTAAVQSLLKMIVHLKPVRLSANEKERWKDFNVTDSLGTRIKALDAAQKVLIDLVVGKFSYNQQSRSGITYVRLYDDEKVYAVDGFLSPMINQGLEHWRNKIIISGAKENWTRLTFSCPTDTGYTLSKKGNKWMIDNEKCDSIKINRFLDRIVHFQGNKFIDKFDAGNQKERFSLKVEGNNQTNTIIVKVYQGPDSTEQYILNSNLNPKAYFSGNAGGLFKTLFPAKSSFL